MGLGDSTFLAHHDDGLSLWSFTSFDLDGFDTIKLFDRRTDERFTAGSSDTSEGGLVFDVSTICDAPQHNRQKGDEVMYFHCSRTDGFSIRRYDTWKILNLNRMFDSERPP